MENIGYLLGDCSRQLRRAFDDRVRALGVTGPQARLLLQLARDEGENQGFYADQLYVEPITLCRMVDRLAEAGLIERRPHPADRRAWSLYLTAAAREKVAALRQCIDGMVEEMLIDIAETDRAAFAQTLIAVSNNLRESKVISYG